MAGRTDESLAESAAAHLERSEQGIPCSRGTTHDMRRQAEQLQKWVEAKGCLIDPDDPGLSSDVPPPRGAEHEVIYREGWKHVLKITHPGTYRIRSNTSRTSADCHSLFLFAPDHPDK